MKGTLPGAALPPCRRPQRGSQSRGRPPPGTGLSPGLSPWDQPQGVTPAATDRNRQDDHRQSPQSARPQRRSGTPKRRRTRPQRIKAGKDKGTTTERAYRLDFALSWYARRGYSRDRMPPEAGGRHQNNVRSNAGGTRRRRYQPGQRNPVAATVRHRLQSPGTARQDLETLPTSRTGSTPVTMKGTLPGAALPPCRRPQHCSQSRERPLARRRIKPWTQPAGSAAGRHPGSDRREPTRRSSAVATISPSAATQRNPEMPKGEASASQGRQRQGNDGRTHLPPRFRPFPVRPPRLSANKKRAHPAP